MRSVVAVVLALGFVVFAAMESRRAERSALSALTAVRPPLQSPLPAGSQPLSRSEPRRAGP